MNSEQYVLNHNFGYGKRKECKKVKKLKLRNFEDLEIYIKDIIKIGFISKTNNNMLHFADNSKIEVVVEKFKE